MSDDYFTREERALLESLDFAADESTEQSTEQDDKSPTFEEVVAAQGDWDTVHDAVRGARAMAAAAAREVDLDVTTYLLLSTMADVHVQSRMLPDEVMFVLRLMAQQTKAGMIAEYKGETEAD